MCSSLLRESSGLGADQIFSWAETDLCAVDSVDSNIVERKRSLLIPQPQRSSDSYLNSVNLRAHPSLCRSLAQSARSHTHRSVMKTRQTHIPAGETPHCVMVNKEL